MQDQTQTHTKHCQAKDNALVTHILLTTRNVHMLSDKYFVGTLSTAWFLKHSLRIIMTEEFMEDKSWRMNR